MHEYFGLSFVGRFVLFRVFFFSFSEVSLYYNTEIHHTMV